MTVYVKKEEEKAYHAVMLNTLTAYDFKMEVPYSAKFWRGKTLANRSYFAKVLPSNLLGSIDSLLEFTAICQSFTRQTPFLHEFTKILPRQNFALYGILYIQ